MSRILVEGEWYDELSSVSYYYESQFENILMSHVKTVFPEYYTLPFKKRVTDGYDTRKPDLAFIRKDYKEWWVVEVELANHNFNHVDSQVRVFRGGIYDSDVVQYFLKKDTEGVLEVEKLDSIIQEKQPKVMVVVDEPQPNWVLKLSKHDAMLCVIQIFKSTSGIEIYRLNGDYPYIFEIKSHCRYKENNLFEVINPDILNVSDTEEVVILYKSKISKWNRIDSTDGVFIKPLGINPLPITKDYVLYKEFGNRYIIDLN